jgi:uncharacterized protein YaeQ
MAATTVLRFEIALSDSDRGVYADLDLRVARHPSESASFMVVRVLAYCLEHADGIAFSKGGVSAVDEPAISIVDPTGRRLTWIEVGAPSAERLHRASKATERVALYTDRRLETLRTSLGRERIHRADAILATSFPRAFLGALEATLDRTNRWSVARSDDHIYVTVAGRAYDTALEPEPLVAAQ